MRYIDFDCLRDETLSYIDKILVLQGPPQYIADNTEDFNENVNSLRFPLYKYFLLPDKTKREHALIYLYNINLQIEQKNEFLSEVRIHDEYGEINAYWIDVYGLINYLKDELEASTAKLDRYYKENGIDPNDELVLFSKNITINTVLNRLYKKLTSGVPLLLPETTYKEAKTKQGLKDDDRVHEILLARNINKKTNSIYDISKYPRQRRGRKIKSLKYGVASPWF